MGIFGIEEVKRAPVRPPRHITGAAGLSKKGDIPIMSQTARTAALYARFSSSKQREASIDDQLRACREWCRREGVAIVAEYADYAISGRTDERPQFQEMIANAGESDIVLVYMMDRFSRDPFDAPLYKHELSKKGVRLVSALEAIPDSPEGIIYEKLLEGLAACESRKTSVRVRRGMEGNALKCLTNGVRVYGYRTGEDGRYEVVPEEAAFVKEAFRRRLGGEACNSIARDFAERGVVSSTGRPCGYTMIYKMLHNEKYIGKYSWGGIETEGGMPRIIGDSEFWRTQKVKGKKQRRNESWGTFALANRVICARCGRNMPGVSGRGRGDVKYEYYGCTHCKMKAVRRDWLEGQIVTRIRELLCDRDEALRIARIVVEAGNDRAVELDRKQARASLIQAETGLRNILNAIEQGVIAPGAKERIAQLEAQRDRARRDLETLDEKTIDPEDFARFLQFGATLTDKAVLEAFVYQVRVDEESVLVTLNYDTQKNEPVRFDIPRVRTELHWCPRADSNRRHPL